MENGHIEERETGESGWRLVVKKDRQIENKKGSKMEKEYTEERETD